MRDDREPNILLRMWRNKDTRSVILQILTMALLFAFLAYIINNAVLNLAILGKTFSFDFLSFPASYDINQRLIEYTSQSTHFRAMLVGILNTALVAFFGIITATIVGFLFGIIRLSNNWIASHIVYCIIEFTRNVPVLLHIELTVCTRAGACTRPGVTYGRFDRAVKEPWDPSQNCHKR